ARLEAQQDLNDVAEPDISRGGCPLACRRRKRDFGQQWRWYGNDRSIGLEDGAVVTASGNPSRRLVDGGYASAEMDCGTLPAAFGCEICDKRAMAFREPPVLTLVTGHPLVAECQRAGTARIRRVVALYGPRDAPPQLIVLPVGKTGLQEIGNRQIGFDRAQSPVEQIHMRRRIIVGQ